MIDRIANNWGFLTAVGLMSALSGAFVAVVHHQFVIPASKGLNEEQLNTMKKEGIHL